VTAGNPAPAGMPPFALELTSAEIAAVVNWIRSDLQGDATIAPRISAHQVEQIRNRSR
jgi:mono/diheme cytochrome c family protein